MHPSVDERPVFPIACLIAMVSYPKGWAITSPLGQLLHCIIIDQPGQQNGVTHMHYQVVAKSGEPSGAWDYYPYWAPVREKSAAERLASYAAQSGYEAAILQSVTPQMLEYVAVRVVERQDTDLLPSLRYLPGAPAARANGNGRQQRAVETAFRPSPVLDPYAEGADKTELDVRRLDAELGPGGDILQQRATVRRRPTLLL